MSPRDHLPRLDGSMLGATFLESLLMGVFYCLLGGTIDALLFRARTRQEGVIRPITITTIILFITITGHWVLDLATAFEAFIRPRSPGFCIESSSLTPAEKTYLNLANWKQVANSALYVTSTVVGDGFMIYRLYIVWGRNKWIIMLPTLLCLTLIGTGTMVTFLFSQAKQPIFKAAGGWITTCFVLTFFCNFYSTSLIAVRIFLSSRQLGRYTDNGLAKIRNILVEAAFLYSVCVLLSLATYVGNSNMQFVFVAANGPVIGIIFCMIVTRAHRSVQGESQTLSSQRSRATGGTHLLRPVAVKITTQVDDEAGAKSFEIVTPPTSPRTYPMGLHRTSYTTTTSGGEI